MHVLTPALGIGPLRFGASSDDVAALLGPPRATSKREARSFHTAEEKRFFKRLSLLDYTHAPVPELAPELEFLDGKLVLIHIAGDANAVSFEQMDVLRHDRAKLVARLRELEPAAVSNEEAIHFPKLALTVSRKKYLREFNYIAASAPGYFAMTPEAQDFDPVKAGPLA
jgi:hypothetical protein